MPDNAAFAKLSAELRQALFDPANIEVLQDFLLFHQLDGQKYTEDLAAKCIYVSPPPSLRPWLHLTSTSLSLITFVYVMMQGVACLGTPTLSGLRLPVLQALDCDGTGIIVPRPGLVCTTLVVQTKLNSANQDRTQRDIVATNGLVHVIDAGSHSLLKTSHAAFLYAMN